MSAPPPDSPAMQPQLAGVNGGTLFSGGRARGGVLPNWAPYGAFGAIVGIYAWSRAVEGPRRAKDRAVTMAIAAAFGIAMAPLISLLYEVIKRGMPGISLEFFTE